MDDLPGFVFDIIQQRHGWRDVTDAGRTAVCVRDARVDIRVAAAAEASMNRMWGSEVQVAPAQ